MNKGAQKRFDMDKQRIKALLKQPEGPKLDFKEKIDLGTESGKKELAKDVLAIANTQGGRGHILIGVKDKSKELVGVSPEDYAEERIQQVLSLRCDPPVSVRVESFLYEMKSLVLITIFRSNNKPHQMVQTGAFYLRRGSTTDIARRDEIAGMLQYNGLLHNEQVPLVHLDMSVLETKRIHQFLKKRHLEKEPQRNQLLIELGIVHFDQETGQYFPTLGGLLLFGTSPEVYMPHLKIKVVNSLESEEEITYLTGPFTEQCSQLESFIDKLKQSYAYPYEALREGVLNAMLHRDYFDLSRTIVIVLGSDQVQISNPGAIFGNERLSDLMKEPNPSRRNHWLYHQLLAFGQDRPFKGYGGGLELIEEAFIGVSKVKYLNLRKSSTFKLVLPGFKHFNPITNNTDL